MSIVLLQGNVVGDDATHPSLAVSFPNPCAVGSLLIAVAMSDTSPGSGGIGATFSDTLGNLWVQPVPGSTLVNDTVNNFQLAMGYVSSSLAGANTVTVTWGAPGNSFERLLIHEYSGASNSGPLDRVALGNGTTTIASAGPITPSLDGALVFGVFSEGSGLISPSWSPISPFIAEFGTPDTMSEDFIQTTSASISATATDPSPTPRWVSLVASFLPPNNNNVNHWLSLLGVGG